MANLNYARGLMNPRLLVGGEPATQEFRVSAGHAVTFYPGQPFTVVGGYAVHFLAANVTHAQMVSMQTQGGGICMSYQPSSTAGTILGITDLHNVEWEVLLSTALTGETTLYGQIGGDVGFANPKGAGRAASYQATLCAVTTHTGVGAARIVGFAGQPDNAFLANPVARVRFIPYEY